MCFSVKTITYTHTQVEMDGLVSLFNLTIYVIAGYSLNLSSLQGPIHINEAYAVNDLIWKMSGGGTHQPQMIGSALTTSLWDWLNKGTDRTQAYLVKCSFHNTKHRLVTGNVHQSWHSNIIKTMRCPELNIIEYYQKNCTVREQDVRQYCGGQVTSCFLFRHSTWTSGFRSASVQQILWTMIRMPTLVQIIQRHYFKLSLPNNLQGPGCPWLPRLQFQTND